MSVTATERAKQLAFPWWTKWMIGGTILLAIVRFLLSLFTLPAGSVFFVGGAVVGSLVGSVLVAAVVTSCLKAGSLLIRVPRSYSNGDN